MSRWIESPKRISVSALTPLRVSECERPAGWRKLFQRETLGLPTIAAGSGLHEYLSMDIYVWISMQGTRIGSQNQNWNENSNPIMKLETGHPIESMESMGFHGLIFENLTCQRSFAAPGLSEDEA